MEEAFEGAVEEAFERRLLEVAFDEAVEEAFKQFVKWLLIKLFEGLLGRIS